MRKSGIADITSHNYAKIKAVFTSKKPMTFHNVIIFIKSVWNKDKNNYYYNTCLEKASYGLPKK